MSRAALLIALSALVGCGGGADSLDAGPGGAAADAGAAPSPDAAGGDAAASPDAGGPSYLTRLASFDDYARLQGQGAEVKYLLAAVGRTPPAPLAEGIFFQDTRRFHFHLAFIKSFPALTAIDVAAYDRLVLRNTSRVWWAGVLKLWPRAPHPVSGQAGVVTFTIYQDPQSPEPLSADQIVEVDRGLKAGAPFAAALLAYAPEGSAQLAQATALRAALAAKGVALVDTATLVPEEGAAGYSQGEGYGYLRRLSRSEDAASCGSRDVVVTEGAPPDAPVLGGLVTSLPQNLHSHVNLRFQEKKIPNAWLRGALDNALVRALEGRLVHVVVTASDVRLAPAGLDEAQAFWRARAPRVGAPQADLGVTALGAFEALRHGDAVAYGVKAANLGELRRLLPAEHRVDGFAIPFAAYDRFVREGALAGQIAALLDDPAARADTVARNARLKALRAAITAAPFEPALLAAVKTAAVTHYGAGATTLPLRFRSSTNAEDLDDLSGAGLYESKSGCLADDEDGDDEGPSRCLTAARKTQLESYLARWQAELAAHPDRHWIGEIVEGVKSDLTKEKPVATAIRKVWASLWNDRAFDDREYYAIDHRRVFMGIAVHPAFHGEQAEAVAVTNLPGGSGAPVFRVVAQLGEVGVVRPIDPSAVPETLTFQRSPAHAPTAVMRLTPSSISPGGAPMWSDAALRVLAGLLFQVQDHFVGVYGGNRARRFDVEVDVTSDARIVVKQVRPNP